MCLMRALTISPDLLWDLKFATADYNQARREAESLLAPEAETTASEVLEAAREVLLAGQHLEEARKAITDRIEEHVGVSVEPLEMEKREPTEAIEAIEAERLRREEIDAALHPATTNL